MADDQLDPAFYQGSNYLGRPTNIRMSGGDPSQAVGTLDAGGVPAGPQGGIPGATRSSDPSARSQAVPGSAGPSILGLLSQGMKIEDIISRLSGSKDLLGGIQAAGGLGQVGEDTIASLLGDRLSPADLQWLAQQFPGGSGVIGDFSAGGGAAAAGAEGAGLATDAALTGMQALGQAAPIWSGLTAAVDLIGEGKFPFEGLLNSIFGFDNPSKAWTSFPGRLGDTLRGEDAATNTLARTLATATPDQVPAAVGAWRDAVGQVVQGFGAGAGPLDIPGMPGATGGRHEGRADVNWQPTEAGLRAMVQAALQGLPPEQRVAAFQGAVRPFTDAKAATEAERARQQALADQQFSLTTGSA